MVEGRSRWRTRLRRHLPWLLVERGVAGKPATDCGEHEWYNAGGDVEECCHCRVGVRPCHPAHFAAHGSSPDGR